MVVPRVPLFSSEALPTSKLSALGDAVSYALDPPACIATRVAVQNLVNNAPNGIIFDTELVDSAAMFAASSTTVSIVDDGVYTVQGWAVIAANTTGMRSLEITQNGSIVLSTATNAPSSFDARLSLGNSFIAAAGDTFGLVAFQNSGGALNLTAARISVIRSTGT